VGAIESGSEAVSLKQNRPIWQFILGALALALMLVCAMVRTGSAEPIVARTENGRFNVRLTGLDRPERVNHLHGLDLWLTTADGKPAVGASIVVTGQHRYALNPLPTSPRVRPGAQDGAYRVEGLRFHIAGEWHLLLAIEFERLHDRLSLEIAVK